MSAELQEEIFGTLWRADRSGLPKYQRVVNAIVEALRRGLWLPGDQLPPEEELVNLTPFSLGTVQRALRDLVTQGLVIRRHGLGSYVAELPRRLQDPWHCRFAADDGVGTVPIYSKATARRIVACDGPWNQYLDMASDEIMQLDRIIDVADEFKVYSRFYAGRSVLRALWEKPMDMLHGMNFKKLIAEECGLPITEMVHHVQVAQFDEGVGEAIEVASGTTGLLLQAIAHAGTRKVVYYQEFYIPPGQRALQLFEKTPAAVRA